MSLSPEACYRALLARDARYDGVFFTAVKTTGIYCRPICPARPPRPQNCIFLPSAAAAQEAGFRPCLRCRPEASPDLGAWNGTSATVSRALKLIEAGGLDSGGVPALAERLGLGERQLRRLFGRHVGASPISVAQTRRVLLARQLLVETGLSVTEVALASGFASVRRFNETIRLLYGRPPTTLRGSWAKREPSSASELRLRLPYKPPYDWDAMLGQLARQCSPGRDGVVAEKYWRWLPYETGIGRLEVSHDAAKSALALTLSLPVLSLLPQIIARARRMFDLGADPASIGAALSEDRWLATLVARRPGIRVVGNWDRVDGDERDSPEDVRSGLSTLLARPIGFSEAQSRYEQWRPWQGYAFQLIDNAIREQEGSVRHASVA